MDFGQVVGLISIVMVFLLHTVAVVWWASGVSTTLKFLQAEIEIVNETLLKLDMERYTTIDAAKDFTIRDTQIAALWKRVDELQSHSNNNSGR